MTDKEEQKERHEFNTLNMAISGLMLHMWDASLQKKDDQVTAAFYTAGQIFMGHKGYVEKLRSRVKAKGVEEQKKLELVQP
jgi:hypothetical protein